MRKIFKNIFKCILLSLLPLYLVVSYYVYGSNADSRVCEKLQVNILDKETAYYLQEQDIEKQIDRFKINPKGKLYGEINTEEMEKVLKENKLLADAQCYKTPRGTICVDVRQRIPIMRIMNGLESYYIDKEGVVIPTINNFSADLILVTGNVPRHFASKELSKLARYLLTNKFWNAQISQIYVDSKLQLEIIPRVGDHVILLGKVDRFEEKLENLRCFYNQVIPQVGWNKYDVINLKFKNQVICSLNGTRQRILSEEKHVVDSTLQSDEEVVLPENNAPTATNL